MSTPELHLQTLFVVDDAGRIVSTREPAPTPGPRFILVRGSAACAWAVHANVDDEISQELNRLAEEEPPIANLKQIPLHAQRYTELVGGRVRAGPDFAFPASSFVPTHRAIERVEDVQLLTRHFPTWIADEIAGRLPILAVIEDGSAVSVCFCARRSDVAAEAGLETAQAYRGRGYGPQVAVAWAQAVRASGRTPLYSTSWDNHASLSVAHKLGLDAYASNWSLTK